VNSEADRSTLTSQWSNVDWVKTRLSGLGQGLDMGQVGPPGPNTCQTMKRPRRGLGPNWALKRSKVVWSRSSVVQLAAVHGRSPQLTVDQVHLPTPLSWVHSETSPRSGRSGPHFPPLLCFHRTVGAVGELIQWALRRLGSAA
jgi:hypothetical protein